MSLSGETGGRDAGVGNAPLENARRLPDGTVVTGSLAEVFPDWQPSERWLFITPHDDDPPLAGGLLLAQAHRHGIPVRVRIATDGSMGYTSAVSAGDVVARRRDETYRSFRGLGVDDVAWWDYPDTRLHLWQGRLRADEADEADEQENAGAGGGPHIVGGPHVVGGYTGLQNSITAELRSYRPTRLFVLSGNDYHPDHKVVHQETMISVFHATGDIWPELGPPIGVGPWVHELAAYRPFVEAPDIRLVGDGDLFAAKLEAVAAFASQTQISQLVEAVRRAGPVEYIRSFRFETYDPAVYDGLFTAGDG